MRVHICAVGRLRKGPERDLYDDYLTRFDRTGRALALGRCRDVIWQNGLAPYAGPRDAGRTAIPRGFNFIRRPLSPRLKLPVRYAKTGQTPIRSSPMSTPKPVVLCILDGWGIGQTTTGNAPALAHTPNFDAIMQGPNAQLLTHGNDAGLPKGQMGNSEVGHTNIGATTAGTVCKPPMPRWSRARVTLPPTRNRPLIPHMPQIKPMTLYAQIAQRRHL